MKGYKSSEYNLPFHLEGDNILVVNTLTSAVTTMTSEEYGELQEGSYDEVSGEVLASQGHIVPEDLSEYELVCENRRRAAEQKDVADLILLSSMGCNFNCAYCYEHKRASNMGEEVVVGVKALIDRIADEYGICRICWFGGEPLLNTRPIFEVGHHVAEIPKRASCVFETSITTNGYLLVREETDALHDLGIRKFMITLDGCRADHDRLRPLQGGEPTYDRIVENIRYLMTYPDTELTLRVNFTKMNAGGGGDFDARGVR